MGKLVYQPEVIEETELDLLLHRIKQFGLKVDHYIVRDLLSEACAELQNEVDNIESGHRN